MMFVIYQCSCNIEKELAYVVCYFDPTWNSTIHYLVSKKNFSSSPQVKTLNFKLYFDSCLLWIFGLLDFIERAFVLDLIYSCVDVLTWALGLLSEYKLPVLRLTLVALRILPNFPQHWKCVIREKKTIYRCNSLVIWDQKIGQI